MSTVVKVVSRISGIRNAVHPDVVLGMNGRYPRRALDELHRGRTSLERRIQGQMLKTNSKPLTIS